MVWNFKGFSWANLDRCIYFEQTSQEEKTTWFVKDLSKVEVQVDPTFAG